MSCGRFHGSVTHGKVCHTHIAKSLTDTDLYDLPVRRQARFTSKLCIQPRVALDYVVNMHLRSLISDHDLLASEQGEMVSLGLHALVRNEFMCTAQLKSRMEAVNVTERLLGIHIPYEREESIFTIYINSGIIFLSRVTASTKTVPGR